MLLYLENILSFSDCLPLQVRKIPFSRQAQYQLKNEPAKIILYQIDGVMPQEKVKID